jgi:hypothetical protein
MKVGSTLALVALLSACGGDDGFDLAAELAAASSGETVQVPAGSYQGPLTVPAGVTLAGTAAAEVKIAAAGGAAALTAETAAGAPTEVEGIHLESASGAALLVKGQGAFSGRRIVVDCSQGVGVAAEGTSTLELVDVQLKGGITEATVKDLAYPLAASQAPIIGLVLSKVQSATLERVDISGFGGFGAALAGSKVSWDGGAVSGNVGVGVIAEGGEVSLKGLAVKGTLRGERGLAVLSYGVVVSGGASVTTDGLEISGGRGFGIAQQGSCAVHQGLLVRANDDVGLWLQNAAGSAGAPALAVRGGSKLHDNRGGGLFVLGSGGVELEEVEVSSTTKKTVSAGTLGAVEMADGIQLSGLTGGVTLENLTVSGNARVGILLSGEPPLEKVALSGVVITGPGKYGLIPENDFVPDASWQFTRDAQLEQADKGLSGTLGAAAPKAGLPDLGKLAQDGLLSSGLLDGKGAVGQGGLD